MTADLVRDDQFPRLGDGGFVESAHDTIGLWAGLNGCAEAAPQLDETFGATTLETVEIVGDHFESGEAVFPGVDIEDGLEFARVVP